MVNVVTDSESLLKLRLAFLAIAMNEASARYVKDMAIILQL